MNLNVVSTANLALLMVAGLVWSPPAAADPIPVTASLAIEIITDTPLDPVVVSGTGIAEIGPGMTIQLPTGLISAKTTVFVVDPMQIDAVAIAGSAVPTTVLSPPRGVVPGPNPALNGAASFVSGGGIAGGFGGVMPISGFALARAFGLIWVPLPINIVGAGGTVMGGIPGLPVTVTGDIWTTGRVTLPRVFETPSGEMTTGTTARTGFKGSNVIQLVTPIRINVGGIGFIPTFGTLTLNVPEPGTLALLGSGLLGLALVGARTRRTA